MNLINVGYDSTNFYVILQGKVGLLVDVGWPGTLPKLEANLRRKDIPLQTIQYLLVTHYHPDHAGLVQEVKAKGVRLIVLEPQLAAIPKLQSYMKPINPYVPITLHDNHLLTIGESRAFLAGLGIAGEIAHTPGHSDDSVTLVLDSGEAFTGDLPSLAVVGDIPDEVVAQSWSTIRSLNATQIYPGHGPTRRLADQEVYP